MRTRTSPASTTNSDSKHVLLTASSKTEERGPRSRPTGPAMFLCTVWYFHGARNEAPSDIQVGSILFQLTLA
ncbi:hypothetical protein ACMFMF_008587 [Clarireedia jacksonii]